MKERETTRCGSADLIHDAIRQGVHRGGERVDNPISQTRPEERERGVRIVTERDEQTLVAKRDSFSRNRAGSNLCDEVVKLRHKRLIIQPVVQ